jgi:hypothetical protein
MSIDRQVIGPDPIAIPRDERIGHLAILDRLLWTSPRKDGGWRPYIDGLRAVAVLAVLFNHSGLVDVPGGFIGVDVFFVISGLLISKVIYDDIGPTADSDSSIFMSGAHGAYCRYSWSSPPPS